MSVNSNTYYVFSESHCVEPWVQRHVRIRITHSDTSQGFRFKARLWHWDGEVLAKADGCGYDMVGSVLADALAKLWPDIAPVDGACGVESVKSYYGGFGFRILDDAEIGFEVQS